MVAPRWFHLAIALAAAPLGARAAEEDFYRMLTMPVPEKIVMEVSGAATLPDGRLAVAIRKGEVWIADKIYADPPSGITYRRFASGLHEPLGLTHRDGSLYTVQRSELTRLRDTDGDGEADEYLTVAKGWGVSGNYHEYAYGPVVDRQGNFWITLNSTLGNRIVPDEAWRGWSIVVRPDGKWEPVAAGFRSPSGVGLNAEDDVFVTDQQGNWFGTCPLIHVKRGAFYGHADSLKSCNLPGATVKNPGPLPVGLTVAEAAKKVSGYQLPAVWFPYRKMGMSSTDVLCDTTGGRFGPFTNQIFVGEFVLSLITRVALEKVHGEYQGACFRFREGFQSAVLRMAWGRDGSMFAGESNRGWNSLGNRSYGLQRLVWTGKTPFEVLWIHAESDGFRIRFTRPVDGVGLAKTGAIKLSSYTYQYHQEYGSEETDTRELTIRSIKTATDGMEARLVVDGLREGFVHEFRLEGIRSAKGEPLLHTDAYYTLNRLP